MMVTMTKKTSSSSEKSELEQDLNRLLRFEKGQQEDCSSFSEMYLTLAMEALRVAIKYLNLMDDAGNLGQYEMKHLNLKRFVETGKK